MSHAEEQNWALTLRKNQQQQKLVRPSLPLVFEHKHLREEIEYQKTKLRIALKNKKLTEVDDIVQQLIGLRARQVGLRLRAAKAERTQITDSKIKQECNAYYHDCYRLLRSVSILTSSAAK